MCNFGQDPDDTPGAYVSPLLEVHVSGRSIIGSAIVALVVVIAYQQYQQRKGN